MGIHYDTLMTTRRDIFKFIIALYPSRRKASLHSSVGLALSFLPFPGCVSNRKASLICLYMGRVILVLMACMFNKKRGCDGEEKTHVNAINRLESQEHSKTVLICDTDTSERHNARFQLSTAPAIKLLNPASDDFLIAYTY